METTTATANAFDVVRNFAKIERPKFVAFEYQNKNERQAVIVLLGANLENVYSRDILALENALNFETDSLRIAVIREVIDSMRESLDKGIGNNSKYTNADTYEHIGANMKIHKETGELYVTGFVVRKTTLEILQPYDKKNSSEKTLAKDNVKRKYTRMAKFRQYIIKPENMLKVSANGNRLILAK